MNKNPFSCGLYESAAMKSVTGDTLRPGGFEPTKRASDFIGIPQGSRILDSGCGIGATMEFLKMEYMADVTGIDPSPVMIEAALKKASSLKAAAGCSENIPFKKDTFDIIFSECCLSHAKSVNASFFEFHRVLKRTGFLALNDLYNREKEQTSEKALPDSGILSLEQIKNVALNAGFRISLFEDHTKLLTQLACDIIFRYGSMENFFAEASGEGCACNFLNLKSNKLGYYLLIAKKV